MLRLYSETSIFFNYNTFDIDTIGSVEKCHCVVGFQIGVFGHLTLLVMQRDRFWRGQSYLSFVGFVVFSSLWSTVSVSHALLDVQNSMSCQHAALRWFIVALGGRTNPNVVAKSV